MNDLITNDLIRQLLEFWETPLARNTWIAYPEHTDEPKEDCIVEIFIRKSTRVYLREWLTVLDLATFEVAEEYRGQGITTSFIDRVEKLGLHIYIENVMSLEFQTFFMNRGYEVVYEEEFLKTRCFLKLS